MRVIFTGSRDWNDPLPIWRELQELLGYYGSQLVIVHGDAASGADALTERMAKTMGIKTERHPAAWGKFGRPAGPIRNKAMLDAGADLVVAFRSHPGSRGTNDTIRQARKRGIEVLLWEPKRGMPSHQDLPHTSASKPKTKLQKLAGALPKIKSAAKPPVKLKDTAFLHAEADGMTLIPSQFATREEAQALVESWLGMFKPNLQLALVDAEAELREAEDEWHEISNVPEPLGHDQAYEMVMAYDKVEKARAWRDKCQDDLDVFNRSVDHLYKHGYLRLEATLRVREESVGEPGNLQLILMPDWPPPPDLEQWYRTRLVTTEEAEAWKKSEQALAALRKKVAKD